MARRSDGNSIRASACTFAAPGVGLEPTTYGLTVRAGVCLVDESIFQSELSEGLESSPIRPANDQETSRMDENGRATKPQMNRHIRRSPQVAKSGPRTLSRWRHGFEPRWDYQANRAVESVISTLVKAQTRASDHGKSAGHARLARHAAVPRPAFVPRGDRPTS